MNPSQSLSPFAQTLNKSDEWMRDIRQELGTPSPESAYRATRGTLHALRDQLIANEAADLAAQLPMLLRGLYFEGYRPSQIPDHVRSREEFLQRVARDLVPGADPPADRACAAVFAAIQRHVTAGEVKDVCQMLPKHIRSLWPGQQKTGEA